MLYSSPIQAARPDDARLRRGRPRSINPELGGRSGLRASPMRPARRGPWPHPRHRAPTSASAEPITMVVLQPRSGELHPSRSIRHRSREAWRRRQAHPALPGETYGVALRRRTQAAFDAAMGAFSCWHWDHRFPVCPLTYPPILDVVLGRTSSGPVARSRRSPSVAERLRGWTTPASPAERGRLPVEDGALKQVLRTRRGASRHSGKRSQTR